MFWRFGSLEDSRPDRYLIKNAAITLEVKDVRKASVELAAAVQAARGYISDTHETVDELGRRSATIQVRVPFIRFDPALQQIEALGKVVEKQITADGQVLLGDILVFTKDNIDKFDF